MNYPLWEIPAPGLLMAFVAIVHVFISHFAVGGGLFLVLTEWKARRSADVELLRYVERHSRFFAMLTLVAGAMTGVGIWFTIGLIHPSATSSLIASFLWGWAIEWTFFVTEIAAALAYAYGWQRLSAATHMRIGWIYFAAAWLSLAVINGILTFMLTPGGWLETRSFWAGVLNPTYFPSLLVRTAASMGLAGVYALLTGSWMSAGQLRIRLARYAALAWALPAAIVVPLGFAWYLAAASGAGVPVAEVFGAQSGSLGAIASAVAARAPSGYPMAQRAVSVLVIAPAVLAVVTIAIALWPRSAYGRVPAFAALACSLATIGAAEWVREDLRKPYIIGRYMFVDGIRMPSVVDDPFATGNVATRGVLQAALWTHPVPVTGDDTRDAIERGREVFRLTCSGCHTTDGYLAIRPLVRGMSVTAAHGLIGRLSPAPGQPGMSWRGRRMPPFPGSNDERHALAIYLSSIGGATTDTIRQAQAATALGDRLFEENCSPCHGPDAQFRFDAKGRSAQQLEQMIEHLPDVNKMMPPFQGTPEERRALAEHLATLHATAGGGAQ
jgi:mono/diheme cytochrome c family protein